jgi:ketosteroid isomerase-like protein
VRAVDARDVAERWVEMYNHPDKYGSDGFLALYSDDLVWRESPTAGSPTGRAGGLAQLRHAATHDAGRFVDRRVDVDEMVVEAGRVVLRYRWSATINADRGPDADGPGPATRVSVEVASFMRVADGRIVESIDILSRPAG